MADQASRDAYHVALERLRRVLDAVEHLEATMAYLNRHKAKILTEIRTLEIKVTGD